MWQHSGTGMFLLVFTFIDFTDLNQQECKRKFSGSINWVFFLLLHTFMASTLIYCQVCRPSIDILNYTTFITSTSMNCMIATLNHHTRLNIIMCRDKKNWTCFNAYYHVPTCHNVNFELFITMIDAHLLFLPKCLLNICDRVNDIKVCFYSEGICSVNWWHMMCIGWLNCVI